MGLNDDGGRIATFYERWPWLDAVVAAAAVLMGFLQWWVPALGLALLATLRTVLRIA